MELELELELEWVVIACTVAIEAVMIILLTLPGLNFLRKGLIVVTTGLLKLFHSCVPYCLFMLWDIYMKYGIIPTCESEECPIMEDEDLLRQESNMKSQCNALLIGVALMLYWTLYSVTKLVVRVDQLNQGIEKLKNKE